MPGRSRATSKRSPTPRRSSDPSRPLPPTSLAPATLDQHDLETESTFTGLGFFDLDLSDRRAESVEFAQCRFHAAALSGSHLNRVKLTDCLVETSNWANLSTHGAAMTRVQFVDSRMTGLIWADGLLQDVTLEGCRLDLSAWRMATFVAVRFTDCNLRGADFTNADLRGAQFVGCDLTGAQFHQATMDGTRFRSCVLLDIAGITSWAGAVVDHADLVALSYALAGALGIRIERDT
ncbi:MAG TPA: pentapeptide repeat-containing protein [Micromonosporaceae bacterium]|nr:pentapeptide repeat-containing protein [Micromonosporaceae bacterium]